MNEIRGSDTPGHNTIGGQLHNSPQLVAEHHGSAMAFNGLNQFVSVYGLTNQCSVNIALCNEGLTFGCWFKIMFVMHNYPSAVNTWGSQRYYGFALRFAKVNGQQIRVHCTIKQPNGLTIEAAFHITLNTWYHATCTWSSTAGVSLYVDGCLVRHTNTPYSGYVNFTNHTKGVMIGRIGNIQFNGTLHSVLIWGDIKDKRFINALATQYILP